MMVAAIQGNFDAVQVIATSGLNLDYQGSVHAAREHGHPEIAAYLNERDPGERNLRELRKLIPSTRH